jgi:hypothetical protein
VWTAVAFGYAAAAERLFRVGARADNVILAAAVGDLPGVRAHFAADGTLLPQTAPSATRIGGWGPPLDPAHLLEYALIYAAALGRADVVAFLLTRPHDPSVVEPLWRNTALASARFHGHTAIVALLERGHSPAGS